MRKRLLLIGALSCMIALAVAGNTWAAGSPDAAQACQNGGYLTMIRADGSGFKNTGDCVSYYAQTNKAAACTVTATTGCLTLANVVLTDSTGDTLTVDAAYSFVTTCNDSDSSLFCPPITNNYATGGGTYRITDPTGAVIEQGTLTTDDNAASQGLDEASYVLTAENRPTTCAAATEREVVLSGTTNDSNDPVAVIGVSTEPGYPGSGFTFVETASGFDFGASTVVPGVSLSC